MTKHIQQFYDCYEIVEIETGDDKVVFKKHMNWLLAGEISHMKTPFPIFILLSLLCILTGCGTADTEKYIL